MTELDEQDIESMRNADRVDAMQRARELRGECRVCGQADCGGCADEDENAESEVPNEMD